MNKPYNLSPYQTIRWKTREVRVGNIGIGGNNPIRIQSMVTSDTLDTEETVKQIVDLEQNGCELVRLTVPSMKDAENLPNIRNKLKQLNSKVPLVADIHFTPSVALYVVDYVEKVRVNPGNFADKKNFKIREYTDSEYLLEIERISDIFSPLVKKCKEKGVAIRIGTNHGSLSDRIMNRYGDTPNGMVESALEFIQIAESEGFYDLIISMKSSNPQVMVQAYRLLVSRMIQLKKNYPLHLGVTEAGGGKDGRIKSSVGIGALLEDGLGDTIRVSLTEDAVKEIPVAKKLVSKYNDPIPKKVFEFKDSIELKEFRNPYTYQRFSSQEVMVGNTGYGENHPVRIETFLSTSRYNEEKINEILNNYQKPKTNQPLEVIHLSAGNKKELGVIQKIVDQYKGRIDFSMDVSNWIEDVVLFQDAFLQVQKICLSSNKFFENFDKLSLYFENLSKKNIPLEIKLSTDHLDKIEEILNGLNKFNLMILFSLDAPAEVLIHSYRRLAFGLKDYSYPILLNSVFSDSENALYEASVGFGGLLLDGIGDCIRIVSPNSELIENLSLSYDLLQACRLRTTKTEYISCPSCGRTLFDLQTTTDRIQKKTGHLKGLKIAIMGCIVNGPGEMADADFGYVGAGVGKVHLYKGKEIVSKSIPSEIADEKLIELIKESGRWVDP
jgi:(E)-4-hydroxy-3-methylbut-2-enyl-diphosphate synthase